MSLILNMLIKSFVYSNILNILSFLSDKKENSMFLSNISYYNGKVETK